MTGMFSASNALLRAATLDGTAAVEAFLAWQAVTDLDHAPSSDYAILPLLYTNLLRLSVEHSQMPRLRGIYRRTWYANNLLWRKLPTWIQQLESAGIPCLLSGPGILAARYYPDLGSRLIDRVTLVVPFEKAVPAVQVLTTLGLKVCAPSLLRDPQRMQRWCDMQLFTLANEYPLELRWHIVPGHSLFVVDDLLWSRAQVVDIQGIAVPALQSIDEFLLTCALLVASPNTASPIRLVDAKQIVDHLVREDRLALPTRAESLGLGSSFELTLGMLCKYLPIPIPEFSGNQKSIDALNVWQSGDGQNSRWSKIRRVWAEYLEWTKARRILRSLRTLGEFLQYRWRSDSTCWDVIAQGIRKLI